MWNVIILLNIEIIFFRLKEISLEKNLIQRVSKLDEGCFPNLEILNLSSNQISFYEDLYPLYEIQNLKYLILFGNPIAHKSKGLFLFFFNLL